MSNQDEKFMLEKECFCKNKTFKKFLVITFAVFIGVFSALCVFKCMHKPHFPMMHYGFYKMHQEFIEDMCDKKHHYQHNKLPEKNNEMNEKIDD